MPFSNSGPPAREFVLHGTGDIYRVSNFDENAYLNESVPDMWRLSDVAPGTGEIIVLGGFFRIYG